MRTSNQEPNRLQKLAMVMELMNMLRKPQMDQQEMLMKQQALEQQAQRQKQLMDAQVLESLTAMSRADTASPVRPEQVMQFMGQMGYNIPQVPQTVNPNDPTNFFKQYQS